jgi:hypothetical protein
MTLGPPIGGALLITGNYDVLWIGVTALGALETLLAWRLIPSRGDYAPEEPPERGSFGVIRRDRAFLLFLVSMALANLVYFAFEVVLPISAVDSHGLTTAAWGFLVIINPALVTLFQFRPGPGDPDLRDRGDALDSGLAGDRGWARAGRSARGPTWAPSPARPRDAGSESARWDHDHR